MSGSANAGGLLGKFGPWLLVLALLAGGARAESIKDSVRFELDEWHEIEEEFGAITVHRIRVREIEAGVKSKIFRPGKSRNTTDVRVEIEYSNSSSRDVEAKLSVHWLDREGRLIDGVEAEEDFNEDERRETTTNTFSTLRYGLEVARTLDFEIRW
ncbi:MAG: hypothetical protein AAF690_24220 [Acidobacteriota bacterium]